MPIDWFTVGAQILNFIVLVWILKRFLYRPVLKAMDERQKRVEESMLAATREKEEAAQERSAFEAKSRDLEREREGILNGATREAEAERARLIEEARAEFQTLQERWRETLRLEQDELREELATRVQREALAVAGQLVRDLADTDLHEQLARKFIQKLEAMPPAERESLAPPADGDDSGEGEAVLRSAFDLNGGLRADLERAARAVIGSQTALRFETRSDLGAGIELAVNGRKASWTMDHYLGSLDAGVRELMERATGANEPKQK
jgi:F-type H+-transporting ATPase subunit b